MHYDIIIISKEFIEQNTDNFNILILKQGKLINENEIEGNITFDYLITDNLDSLTNIDILIEDNVVICNYFLQTSIDNIFYIGIENKSKKPITEQLKLIIEYIND